MGRRAKTKKAGAVKPFQPFCEERAGLAGGSRWGAKRLERNEHVAGALDRLGYAALLLGGQMGVFAGEDLAGVGDVTVHQLGLGEGELLGSKTALRGGGFGGAHFEKGRDQNRRHAVLSTCIPAPARTAIAGSAREGRT